MKSKRRAFTLVEMVAVISVGSVILVLAMKMVHRTMRIESQANERAGVERTATRLSRQFRHDVHRAASFSIEPAQAETTVLKLMQPGAISIIYRADKNGMVRQQARESDQTHREAYSFADGVAIEMTQLTDPQRVGLTIHSDTGLTNIAPRSILHVEAVVGRLLRLSPSQAVLP